MLRLERQKVGQGAIENSDPFFVFSPWGSTISSKPIYIQQERFRLDTVLLKQIQTWQGLPVLEQYVASLLQVVVGLSLFLNGLNNAVGLLEVVQCHFKSRSAKLLPPVLPYLCF